MHETTFIDTHQAQNEQFSVFFAFFPAKKRNIQHMQQKNIDELHKNVQYFFGREFRA